MTPSELVDIAPNVQPGTQYAELIEIAHDTLRAQNKQSGADFSFDDLIAKMDELAPKLELKPITTRAAIARIKQLSANPLIGTRFDFIENLKKKRLIVLDCRYLTLASTRLECRG